MQAPLEIRLYFNLNIYYGQKGRYFNSHLSVKKKFYAKIFSEGLLTGQGMV